MNEGKSHCAPIDRNGSSMAMNLFCILNDRQLQEGAVRLSKWYQTPCYLATCPVGAEKYGITEIGLIGPGSFRTS